MTEKDLIKQLKTLNEYKPRKEWVSLTKTQILGKEPEFSFFPVLRPILTTTFAFCLIFSLFSFAQTSLPGDFLYSLKKAGEKSQSFFVSEDHAIDYDLKIANKRLGELAEIAETNKIDKLASAIREVQQTMPQTTENLKKIIESEKDIESIRGIVRETDKLEEQRQGIKALGIVLDRSQEEELEKTAQQLRAELVEREIKDLEKRTLTEEQEKILKSIKQDFEDNNYSQALDKIYFLSNCKN